MCGIGVHTWMPRHKILERSQNFRWLENLNASIARLKFGDSSWDSRDQICARNTPDRGAEVGDPDRTAALNTDRGQSFVRNRRQSSQDAHSDVTCCEILLQRQST